jgi:hypothetical protein
MIEGHAGGADQHEVQGRGQSQVEVNAPDNAQGSSAETHIVIIMKLKMNFIFKIRIYSLMGGLRPVKAFTAVGGEVDHNGFCITPPHVRILFFIEK